MAQEWRFCLSDVALQRYDSADFEKNAFSLRRELYTVTRDGFELRKAAHVFSSWRVGLGCGEDQHVWDGLYLKDPCLFGTFLESQNYRKKLIL